MRRVSPSLGSPPSFAGEEQGAALLTILLLVAVMAVAVGATLERLSIATRLTATATGLDRIRLTSLALERVALARIDGEWRRLQQQGGPQTWANQTIALPLPGGARGWVTARDGGNCFNLNSLAQRASPTAPLIANAGAINQFAALLGVLAVSTAKARGISAAAADWIDADALPVEGGSEQDAHNRPVPNRAMLDISELVDVSGMTPAIFGQVAPYVCALPDHTLSALNIETLRPDQAPLIAMLIAGRITVPQARALLSSRPAGGYGSVANFWSQPLLNTSRPDPETAAQLRVATRFMRLESRVTLGEVTLEAVTLIDTGPAPARIVHRRWALADNRAMAGKGA